MRPSVFNITHLIHFFPALPPNILQGELPHRVAVVPTAHVHHQEPVVLVGVDLMEGEHGPALVPHVACLPNAQ